MATVAEILAARAARPVTQKVPLWLDETVGAELAAAQAAHRHAPSDDTASRLAEAKKAAEGQCVVVTLGRIGGHALEQIRDAHPPTVEQRAAARQAQLDAGRARHELVELVHNPDTYPPALIAACAVDPEMTYDEAVELWTAPSTSQADRVRLFQAAEAVNTVSPGGGLPEG